MRHFLFGCRGGAAVVALLGAGLAQSYPGLATFTDPSASYLFSAPTGSYTDISGYTGISSLTVAVNVHNPSPSYDYPVQYTDGTHGTTTFDDYHWYSRNDQYAVPNVTSTGGFFPSTGTDGHLVVIDTSTRMAYEFWRLCTNASGTPTQCSGNYSATSIGWIMAFSVNSSNGGPGGGTASGISGLAGDIMPTELDSGAPVPHALLAYATYTQINGNICSSVPATGTDGSTAGAPLCEGARVRMDPSIDVDSLSASNAAKAIMKALQLYGAIISDQSSCSSCFGFYSDLQNAPDLTGLQSNFFSHIWVYTSH